MKLPKEHLKEGSKLGLRALVSFGAGMGGVAAGTAVTAGTTTTAAAGTAAAGTAVVNGIIAGTAATGTLAAAPVLVPLALGAASVAGAVWITKKIFK